MAVHSKDEKANFVRLRSDELIPLQYFAVAISALMAELTAYLDTNLARSQISIWSAESPGSEFAWPQTLQRYFVPAHDREKLTQLRLGLPGDARRELLSLLCSRTVDFLAKLKSLGIDDNLVELGPLSFFSEFARKAGEYEELDSFLSEFEPTFDADVTNEEYKQLRTDGIAVTERKTHSNHTKIRLSFQAAVDRKLKDKQNRHRLRANFDALAIACTNFLRWKIGGIGISYILPGIPISRIHLSSSRLIPQTIPRDGDAFGFFSILREARGTVTNRPEHRNIVVRDLLWLRPHTSNYGATGFSDQLTGHGSRLGYYFSAFDSKVYEVRRVIRQSDDMIMIDAIAYLDRMDSQSLCLYFPLMPAAPYLWSPGTIMGHARTSRPSKRTGAWTAMFFRPSLPEREMINLSNTLSIYTESLRQDSRGDYDRNITGLMHYIEAAFGLGIIFSDEMYKNSFGKERRELASKVRSFRKLYYQDRDYMDSVEQEINRRIDQVSDNVEMLKKYIRNIIVEQNMYCITPHIEGSNPRHGFDEELQLLSQQATPALEYFSKWEVPE